MSEHTLTLFIKKHFKTNQITVKKLERICFLIDLDLKDNNIENLFSKKYFLADGYPQMPQNAIKKNFKHLNISNGLVLSINNTYNKEEFFDKHIYDLFTAFYFMGIKEINKIVKEKLNIVKILNNNIYFCSCSKKPFTKELASLLIARKFNAETNKNRITREIRYYFCDLCNAYHLTSQPKRGSQS